MAKGNGGGGVADCGAAGAVWRRRVRGEAGCLWGFRAGGCGKAGRLYKNHRIRVVRGAAGGVF